ncbi:MULTISPECIES: helix-turn-helix domain-containing protein [unclassified Variovorax]|uniref:helix-turn-helix domain-containing protein n=1 Tax=unclassified Variovorax TaxID=663243 RepID=UPI00076D6E13|nr:MULTISPECIES: helix-turn-helix domain-containing protein [unclassified Variovorax]KWT98065.1 hypothetical protein APY03_0736 [Variovorax sp. WDL1]PNG50460.1 hypothetical protein CHC06_06084 [Variovorax sp. B2]PNG51333.1 hypothetical protein CHC07_05990 [Variovorax sp. B4]VTU43227.1 transcriptional repressor DicA [Variovorax sp. PBL-H6]VTU43367.1 transcriptional repressor DicA [Variovorax sp. SRS16]
MPATANQVDATSRKRKLDLADRLELGARLRKLREATGKTTLEIAEEVLGYQGSHAAVSRLERGVFSVVNLDHLDKLASRYATDSATLLKGTGDVETAALPEVTGEWSFDDIAPGIHFRLRDLRQALGLSRAQMATRLGHSTATVLKGWEERLATPRPDTILRIATEFGVSGSWLILGAKGKAPRPTQSMRLRALRHASDVSRNQLAMKVEPLDFQGLRTAISHAESGVRGLPSDRLQSIAKAFDVPADWLDPEGLRYAPATPIDAPAQSEADYLAGLPATVRSLVNNLVAMFTTGLLDSGDVASVNKELSRRAWKRATPSTAPVSGAQVGDVRRSRIVTA